MRNAQSHTVNPSRLQMNEDPHHLNDTDEEQLQQGLTMFHSMFYVEGNLGPRFGSFLDHVINTWGV